MTVISQAQLAAMSRRQQTAMPDTVTVVRKGTGVSDGQGGLNYGAATTHTVPGRLADLGRTQLSSLEPVIAHRLGTRVPYRLTVPAFADLLNTDQVQVRGKTYEVLAVQTVSFETATRCIVAEVS